MKEQSAEIQLLEDEKKLLLMREAELNKEEEKANALKNAISNAGKKFGRVVHLLRDKVSDQAEIQPNQNLNDIALPLVFIFTISLPFQ